MIHGIILTDTIAEYGLKPLGAYAIANILRTAGFNIVVIDIYTKFSQEQLQQLLEKFITQDTLFLGYSSTLFVKWNLANNDYTWLLTDVGLFVKTNHFAKTINPNLKIIFGGSASHQFINDAKENKNNFLVDYVMHGYGESMIVDLVNNIKLKKTTKYSRKTCGIYEIDYDFKGLNHKFRDHTFIWDSKDLVSMGESLPIEVARGCIFRCKFCSFPLLGKNKNDNSYLKTEDILLNEILNNYDQSKTLNYFIVDDTFNERTDKIEMLLKIRDKTKLDLTFSGYARLDLIHRFPQQTKLLHELNFLGYLFGIESLNHSSAKSIGKGLQPQVQIETLYKIRDVYKDQVSLTGSFIIGLPHESPETFSKWADWVISKESPLDVVVFAPLIIGQIKNTHSESDFFYNYGQYGYTLSEDRKVWFNQYWNFMECGKLMFDYMHKVESSGKQSVPPITAMALTKLGYSFKSLIKTKLREIIDVNGNRLIKRPLRDDITDKFIKWQDNYFNSLLNLHKLYHNV